jgi:hypothetical protein
VFARVDELARFHEVDLQATGQVVDLVGDRARDESRATIPDRVAGEIETRDRHVHGSRDLGDQVLHRQAPFPADLDAARVDDFGIDEHESHAFDLDHRDPGAMTDLRGREPEAARRPHRGEQILDEAVDTVVGQANGPGRPAQSSVGQTDDRTDRWSSHQIDGGC